MFSIHILPSWGLYIHSWAWRGDKISCHGDVSPLFSWLLRWLLWLLWKDFHMYWYIVIVHRSWGIFILKMWKKRGWLERNSMLRMSTIVEAKPLDLQPYYCFSLNILRPIFFYPKLLLEGRQHVGLFLHTLKRIGRREHYEILLRK